MELDRDRGVSNFAVAEAEALSAAREVVRGGRWDVSVLSVATSISLEKGTMYKAGRTWSDAGG